MCTYTCTCKRKKEGGREGRTKKEREGLKKGWMEGGREAQREGGRNSLEGPEALRKKISMIVRKDRRPRSEVALCEKKSHYTSRAVLSSPLSIPEFCSTFC